MTSKLKTDVLETVSGSGTIALTNQLSGMTSASLPTLTHAEMPAGSLLQTVQTGSFSRVTISSAGSGWTSTNNTLSITPSSTNSKIQVTVTQSLRIGGTGNLTRGGLRLQRGSTTIWNTANNVETIQVRNADNEHDTVATIIQLDAPASTSTTTYTLQALLHTGNAFYLWESAYGANMILQEIQG